MDAVDLSNLHILIVDDESGALEALADIFEDQHCRVTTASSASEARAAYQSQQFDVALLDIRLPDARGTDLLREIRTSCDATRCIMVTASSEAEDAINALNEGASAYIQKPIDIDAMQRTIVSVVTKYLQSADERRKLRDLDVVKNVGVAAMDLDLDRMLTNVVRNSVDGMRADAGAVLLYDDHTRCLKGAVQYNMGDLPASEYVVTIGEGIAGKAAAERRVVDVEDIAAASIGSPGYLRHSGIASAMAAPIIMPKGLIGSVIVAWRTPRAFTVQDRDLIGVISQRLSLAISNARLYAREDASKQRAEYLAKVSQELNSRIEDVRKVARRVTRLATERLGDCCVINLVHRDTNSLEPMGAYHRVAAKQSLLERGQRLQSGTLSAAIIERMLATREPTIRTPEELEAAYPSYVPDSSMNMTSLLTVPLRAHGELIGIMYCAITESDDHHDAERASLALEFADRAAVAIENAMLLRDAELKGQELQALFTLTRSISSSLQEADVIQSVLQGTAHLMSVPFCCVATSTPGRGTVKIDRAIGLSSAAAQELATALLDAWPVDLLANVDPFYVEDLGDCHNDHISDVARHHKVTSVLSVPLEVEGFRERLLMVMTRQRAKDLPGKRQLLATLGALAGVALTNARSYKRELTIAQRVQQWILTTQFGEAREMCAVGFDIATDYHAALVEASVGGDFYDVFPVGDDLLGIVMGDVSGKGLDAALQAQAAKHTLRAYALNSQSPSYVLKLTNNAICRMLPSDVFITLFYAILNTRTRTLTWANAGHDSPLLCDSKSTITALESSGRALGLMAGADYSEASVVLTRGDVLLMYTDGLTEARREGVFLDTEGAINMLLQHAHLSARDLVHRVYDDVRAYSSGELHDDIALLALKAVA